MPPELVISWYRSGYKVFRQLTRHSLAARLGWHYQRNTPKQHLTGGKIMSKFPEFAALTSYDQDLTADAEWGVAFIVSGDKSALGRKGFVPVFGTLWEQRGVTGHVRGLRMGKRIPGEDDE